VDEREISALAVAYQRGDERSFKTLVDGLSRGLIAMAYRYTGDWEWARDLTQETWIKVHDRIHSYDPARSFRGWLLTVHRNGCLDHLRRAWVRLESAPGDEAIGGYAAASSFGNPHEDLERREFHERLLVALGELSESQRQVFVRVDLEQNDQREVAEALGMKFTTLRTTLHFARKRLAAVLVAMEESL
jgi:RNA polymerase sigma-70 factor (ECF subfamily)